jgi:hypothetical protein
VRPFFYALKMGEALGNGTTGWSGRPSFAMRLPPRIRHKKKAGGLATAGPEHF